MGLLDNLDYEDTQALDAATAQIREIVVKSSMPKEMEDEILESYDILSSSEDKSKEGMAHDILQNAKEPTFVAVRSSATAEDLAEASFAGQQDSYLNVKGGASLITHVKRCFASLFTSRATYYRHKKGFEHAKVSLAAVVQKMVDSDKSGVMFSKDPAYKKDHIVMEAVWGLGEGIVSGAITPDRYLVSQELEILDVKVANKKIAMMRDSGGGKKIEKLREEKSKHQVLKSHEIVKLAELAKKLEAHYDKPQDIEFAIEGDEVFIVQTRPITTIEGRGDKAQEIKGEPILEGLAASPGIAVGKVKIINDLADLHKIVVGDIMVTKMTNPDMVVAMQKSAGIVTDEGGMTAHAAIVSREMGIPAIVGTEEATIRLKEGEFVTIDGFNGKVYKGKVAQAKQKEVKEVTAKTKTHIKVIVDLPSFAERAAKTGLKKVGLTRVEGIIAESGKHPEYFLKQGKIEDYEEIIYKGIHEIASYFEGVWVRTSDIRTDEYRNLEGAPQELEANPMLGFHGIRYSLKNPEILKAELRALSRVAKEGKEMGILMPQVILLSELQETKKILKEIGADSHIKVGIMIETPAAVQLIRDFCKEGIDFVSFGTNDLTQYMLAIDRGNEEVQYLYDEMHPAILYQMGYVIRVCKRAGVESSICGQAGSKPEMAKYLVSQGIDSISVNADKAEEIAQIVAGIEKELVEGTDKEPRKVELAKKEESVETNEEVTQDNSAAIEEEKREYESKQPEVVETKKEIVEDIVGTGVSENQAEVEEKIDEKVQGM